MVPHVVAEGGKFLAVSAQVLVVLLGQLPPLEEEPRLGAALCLRLEQMDEGGQDARPQGRERQLPQQEPGQTHLEAGAELEQQLLSPLRLRQGMDAPDCHAQSQRRQEQRREQAVEAVFPLHPDHGQHAGGHQAQQSDVLRHSRQRRRCSGAPQQGGQAVERRRAPQHPAQPSAAPLSQKDQQRGQAQGAAQGVPIRLRVREVAPQKADGRQGGEHEGKDGQGSQGQPGVPPPPEALP